MRHIGNIADKKQAERFVHFLVAQDIEAALRPAQDTGYAVWVLEEDRVATARQHLAAFLAKPDNQRFAVARVHQRRRPPEQPLTITLRQPRQHPINHPQLNQLALLGPRPITGLPARQRRRPPVRRLRRARWMIEVGRK